MPSWWSIPRAWIVDYCAQQVLLKLESMGLIAGLTRPGCKGRENGRPSGRPFFVPVRPCAEPNRALVRWIPASWAESARIHPRKIKNGNVI